MPSLHKISEAEVPSPYRNHVLLQRTKAGRIRLTGTLNVNGLAYYAPPQFGSMERALASAIEWAERHGVDDVYIYEINN